MKSRRPLRIDVSSSIAATCCLLMATLAAAEDRVEIVRSAIDRGQAFLHREVTRWKPENGCFSCHNNGDGVRTLVLVTDPNTGRQQRRVQSLAATVEFLQAPATWEQNGPAGEFNDTELADIHFTLALSDLKQAGLPIRSESLHAAFDRTVRLQTPAGYWLTDRTSPIGSPVTLGNELATAELAQRMAGSARPADRQAAARARRWLAETDGRSNLGMAARLRALTGQPEADEQKLARYVERILADQDRSGGWGAYPMRPPEVFDTAVMLDTLCRMKPTAGTTRALDQAADFLTREQLHSGEWIESTRPHPRDSYAQRIATTAWAVRALEAFRQRHQTQAGSP